MQRATVLALEDGSSFWGEAFGDAVNVGGEVVFNTSMTGYQEVATDASYRGQIVVFTYPLIGNYGTFPRAAESRRPWAEAIVVRELTEPVRAGVASFHEYLRSYGVPGLAGIDTRALVRRLRSKGTMRGYLLQVRPEEAGDAAVAHEAIEKARAVPRLADRAVVAEVSGAERENAGPSGGPRVALLDTGVKENQVRLLAARGATVRLFPAAARASEILGWRPDGILLSNGPGDPASLEAVVRTTRLLLDASTTRGNGHPLPIFGICLGHQLVARAIGATTSRLPFGHHGANHPVQDVRSGRVAITSQNHEFQVDEKAVDPRSGFYVSHRNLNDGSVEGLAHKSLPIRTLQFHPEAAPGPEDNQSAFDDFLRLCRRDA
ncbi:MAG: carbamoyl phosphate synthase small subunit [Chloroflexi bacterium 13_1_40CM_4_68_4]|nr:MAG: carbamoyl phosphate synthase small subunit [Chloroflexi bacterium 13_1_40CM_4_68_4]